MAEIRFDLVGDSSALTTSLDDARASMVSTREATRQLAEEQKKTDKATAEAAKATAKLTAEQEKAAKATDDWRASFKGLSAKELEDVNKAVPSTTDKIKGLTVSLAPAAGAITLAATAALGLAAHASAAGDAVALLSARSGVSQETVVALQSALRAGGADAGILNEALGGLVGKLKEAQVDGSAGAAAFADLGVSLKDTNGVMRSTDDILADVLDSIAAAPSDTDKATRAVALLGESGGKMAAALSGGNAQLDEWREKTAGLSTALREGATDGAAYNTAMEELNISIETLKIQIGNGLLPQVAALASTLGQVIGPIHSVLSTLSYYANVPSRVAEGFLSLGKAMRDAIEPGLTNGEVYGQNAKTAETYEETMAKLGIAIDVAADSEKKMVVETEKVIPAVTRTATAVTAAKVAVVEYGAAFNAMVLQAANATKAQNTFADSSAETARKQIDRDLALRDETAARIAAEQAQYEKQQADMQTAHEKRMADTATAEEALNAYIMDSISATTSGLVGLMDASNAVTASISATVEGAVGLIEGLITGAELSVDNLAAMVSGVIGLVGSAAAMMATTEREEAERAAATVAELQAQLAAAGEETTAAERKQIAARLLAAQEAAAIQDAESKEARQKAHRAQQAAGLAQGAISAATAALALIPSFAFLGPGAPIAAAAVAGGAFAVQAATILSTPAPEFRTGGVVGEDAPRAPGGLSDQRMAVVEPGEVILRPDQARALGGSGGGMTDVLLTQAVGYLRGIERAVASAGRPRYDAASALAGGYR